MRIKRSVMASYLIVLLIPILIASLIGIMIIRTNRDVQVRDYVTNTFLIQKYTDKLEDPKWYYGGQDYSSIIDGEDDELVDIRLQNYEGRLIYDSNQKSVNFSINSSRENLLKGLYERRYAANSDSIKLPVIQGEQIIGIYTITIHRVEFINQINEIILSGTTVFLITLLLLFAFANRFTEKRINQPIQQLIFAINEFAQDRLVQVPVTYDDEIGEVIRNFQNMQRDIQEKRDQLKIEQAEREYMVMAISHDLKTPLTAIRTNTELMQVTGRLDEAKAQVVLDKCDYMKQMLEDLLDYNILQSDSSIQLVRVDGREAMETILYGYQELIEANGLKGFMEIKMLGEYDMDVAQMERVMGNLIINGIKYSKTGGNLYVGAYSEEFALPNTLSDAVQEKHLERRGKLTLVVQNTAERLSDDELKKITTPFYKVDQSRNLEQSGAGLGLSIVVLIVEKHGGTVEFYSEEECLTVVIELDRRA